MEFARLNGMSWYAVYTHVNFEVLVTEALEAQGFEVYLPLLRCWDRKKGTLSWKPAFPRYVFVHCYLTPNEWRAIKKTRGVLRFVGMDKPEPIPTREIQSVRILIENSNGEVEGHPFLKIGDMVKVVSGPFKGAVGYLVEICKKHKLLVGIEVLGRAVMVEIDASNVRPLDPWEQGN
ncbi:MAG: transcription termination/antitermination protein NusG [Candidatus Fervidibacter sp.]|uniref:transcription termination/antitermination protein NusG n=1 Tax=Candidatus Fervidibacter sp. TaxID=3100871 RepID=UPI00404B958C